MMRFVGFVLVLLTLLLLQVGFFAGMLPYGIAPNFLLAGAVLWILLERDTMALGWALASGVLLDILSPGAFGLYAVLFLVVMAVMILLRAQLVTPKARFSHVTLMMLVSAFVLVVPLLARPVLRVFVPSVLVPDWSWVLLATLAASFALDIAAVFVMRPVFRWLNDLFQLADRRRSRLKPFG